MARLGLAAFFELAGAACGVASPPNPFHCGTWRLREHYHWLWNAGEGVQGDVVILHKSRRLGVRLVNGSNGWFTVQTRNGHEHTWYSNAGAPSDDGPAGRAHRDVIGMVRDTDGWVDGSPAYEKAMAQPLPEYFVPLLQLQPGLDRHPRLAVDWNFVGPGDFTLWLHAKEDKHAVSFGHDFVARSNGLISVNDTSAVKSSDRLRELTSRVPVVQ